MSLVRTVGHLLGHPLNKRHRFKAISRFMRWQFGSRILKSPVAAPFTDHARLLVSKGMMGATGNIYCGLHEYEDMAFTVHLLRRGDLFVDIGANIGSYSVLAGKVASAHCIAVEPIPTTFEHLMDNISLNRLQGHVRCRNVGISSRPGELRFTSNLDTVNHVAIDNDSSEYSVVVPTVSLDSLIDEELPFLVKVDVEGFESQVLQGGQRTFANPSLQAVIMELNGSGTRYGINDDELHSQMLQFGFAPHSYDPRSRRLISLNGSHFCSGNTLYVRDAGAVQRRLEQAPMISVNGERL